MRHHPDRHEARSLSSRRAWIEILPPDTAANDSTRSLSSRRAWIEIPHPFHPRLRRARRSPHGERGLKCRQRARIRAQERRSPHGERGLKLLDHLMMARELVGRSPHGERGLKS